MTVFYLCAGVWWVAGTAGVCFWHCEKEPLIVSDVPKAMLVGMIGPVTWFLGWLIYNDRAGAILKKVDEFFDKTIWKARKP